MLVSFRNLDWISLICYIRITLVAFCWSNSGGRMVHMVALTIMGFEVRLPLVTAGFATRITIFGIENLRRMTMTLWTFNHCCIARRTHFRSLHMFALCQCV